jgi:hypothetical protein
MGLIVTLVVLFGDFNCRVTRHPDIIDITPSG